MRPKSPIKSPTVICRECRIKVIGVRREDGVLVAAVHHPTYAPYATCVGSGHPGIKFSSLSARQSGVGKKPKECRCTERY